MANTTGTGGFQKGRSGNPGGRPKADHLVSDLAKQHTEEALKTLITVMSDKEQPAAARVSAATSVLDRGWGKPTQPSDINLNTNLADILQSIGK